MNSTPSGILLVDKPETWTSHDVVAKARRALGTKKVGHAGTLDPMATGLLVLGVGAATRLLTHLVGLDKRYTATMRLGQSTVTDDRDGEILTIADERAVAELVDHPERLDDACARLTGPIEQVPSAVSAIKVNGTRAYDLVRAGRPVELRKRPVTVRAFELGEPRAVRSGDGGLVLDVDAVVECTSGTYVRALARDLGIALGVGAHLTALRRTSVGPFAVEDALPHAALLDAADAVQHGEAAGPLPLREPAEIAKRLFPSLSLSADEEIDLGHGKRLELGPDRCRDAPIVAAISPGGRLVGLIEVAHGRARVITNFPVLA